MFKIMFVTATVALLFVACSDNSAVTGPTVLNQLPRASDGISPTDYINMHNLSRPETQLEGFSPQDTIFAADYIVNGEDSEGRTITITTTDYEGNTSTTIYSFSELCGHYIVIHGPTQSLGSLVTYEGCPEQLPGGYAIYRGHNTNLDTYLDSLR